MTGRLFLPVFLFALCIVFACAGKGQAQQEADLSRLNNPALIIAGQRLAAPMPPPEVRQNKLILPIRPVAQRLLADLTIDTAQQVISVIRADDRAQITFDGKTGTLTIRGAPPRDIRDAHLVDFTPQQETVPQSLLEMLFNVFVAVDTEKNEISVVPNSPAFASALEEYEEEVASQPQQRFRLPRFNLNALQYQSMLNQNNITQTGQTTTGRFSASIGRTVFNGYATYLGSTNGPGFRYSIGGLNIIRPRFGEAKIGDYALRTGSLFANGFSRGLVMERVFGAGTKVGFSAGKLQSSLQLVGIQTQRPLFLRPAGLIYGTIDSNDFRHTSAFWRNHQLYAGTGFGGFADENNPNLHSRGYVWYLFARDSFSRFNGNLRSATDFDMGMSLSRADTTIPGSPYLSGSVFLLKQRTTLFKRITLNTIIQRGSPNWSTLDISNVYRNNFLVLQGVSVNVMRGVGLFFNGARTSSTDENSDVVTRIYTAGGSFNRYPRVLPEITLSTNLNQRPHSATQYFNTVSYRWNVPLTRTRLSGQWLSSNNGPDNSSIYSFSLRTKTTLYKSSSFDFFRQWASPQTTTTNVGVDSGQLLSNRLRATWSIGNIIAPIIGTQKTMTAALNVILPYNQVASVAFSRVAENYQVIINMTGAVGRQRNMLTESRAPVRTETPTGTVQGRFYIDNNLSGSYEPGVDQPLPNLRVIVSGTVADAPTDAEGRYVIRGLTRGFVSMRTDYSSIPANLAYFSPSVQDVFVVPNRTRTLDFRFARFGRVSGTVTAEGPVPGNALQDIRVFIVGTDRDTLTSPDGSWQIPDLTPGKYVAKIDPEYVAPSLEILVGEIPIDVAPGGRLTGVEFKVRAHPEVFEEREF